MKTGGCQIFSQRYGQAGFAVVFVSSCKSRLSGIVLTERKGQVLLSFPEGRHPLHLQIGCRSNLAGLPTSFLWRSMDCLRLFSSASFRSCSFSAIVFLQRSQHISGAVQQFFYACQKRFHFFNSFFCGLSRYGFYPSNTCGLWLLH